MITAVCSELAGALLLKDGDQVHTHSANRPPSANCWSFVFANL